MTGSFWVAAAVSWLTVTSGAWTVWPSSVLYRTCDGVIGLFGAGLVARSLASASWRMKFDRLISRPWFWAAWTAAALPARVLVSYVVWDAAVDLVPVATMASEGARRIAMEMGFNLCFAAYIS